MLAFLIKDYFIIFFVTFQDLDTISESQNNFQIASNYFRPVTHTVMPLYFDCSAKVCFEHSIWYLHVHVLITEILKSWFAGLADGDINYASELLKPCLKQYPKVKFDSCILSWCQLFFVTFCLFNLFRNNEKNWYYLKHLENV